jgi:hypothetical protein
MSTLNSILPPKLRAHNPNYYSDESSHSNFVVINIVGITGFNINMGKWSHTSDPKKDREGVNLITLDKPDTQTKDNTRHFDQESPHVIRQDEFGWLLYEIQRCSSYNRLIEYASSGFYTAIVIYNYLSLLAKQFNTEAMSIFDYLNSFTYRPEELMSKPW